jgi:predicted cupin superfamily sugar epimerase
MTKAALTAARVIQTLGLQRHPEGGWFAETFRDNPGGGRGHSTAIYFLLEAGDRSHWHRVTDAAEVWHWYAGDPLKLQEASSGSGRIETIDLGPDLQNGQRPQHVVGAGHWQSAATTGDWTLVGCTVAPGFEFDSFVLAPPDWKPGGPF